MRAFPFFAIVVVSLSAATVVRAADNELTPDEKADGWILLFNGQDYTGWKCNNGEKIASPIEDGALVPYKSGGYLIIYEKPFGDFVLQCDVKMSEQCNSGVFFRVGDPAAPVQTGFEVQVMNSSEAGYHDFGAIYDLVKPSKNNLKGQGEWNRLEITCKGPHLSVAVNGEMVTKMNCDEFTEAGKRPDGTQHKFKQAIKDFPRRGYLGFQDHGHKVWFKNIKLKELSAARKASASEILDDLVAGLNANDRDARRDASARLIELAKQPKVIAEIAEVVRRRIKDDAKASHMEEKRTVINVAWYAKNFDLAAEFAGLCIDEEPANYFYYRTKALAHEYAGKTSEGINAIEQALRKFTDERTKLVLVLTAVEILEHAGEIDKAIELCEQSVDEFALSDDAPRFRLALARYYTLKNQMAKAEEQLLLLVEADPQTITPNYQATANNDLGYTWADANKNLDRAESMIRMALEVEPRNAAYLDSMGWVLYRKGKYEEAVRYLKQATTRPSGNDGVIWDHLGDCYVKLNKSDDARAAFNKALELIEKDGDKAKVEAKIKQLEN